VAQAFGRRHLYGKARGVSKTRVALGHVTHEHFGFPRQYHSTNGPESFSGLKPTPYTLSNFQRR
jgi:hypothetical protein